MHRKLMLLSLVTLPPVVERSIVMTVSVCLSVCVCLSGSISPEMHVRSISVTSIAVARSSSGGVAVRYVLRFMDDGILAHNPRQLNVAAKVQTWTWL